MGLCHCKEKDEAEETFNQNNRELTRVTRAEATVDDLVLEILGVIGFLVDNEQEPPMSLIKLHSIAEEEGGWIQVVSSMVKVIPMEDPLGPVVITLLLEDCPLPTKESVVKVSTLFSLSSQRALQVNNVTTERNICIILSCIAEKLAGPSSIAMLSPSTLDYLLTYLKTDNDANIVLFALIALEKFALTSENRITIKKRLLAEPNNPLVSLEACIGHEDFIWRQVGFCAQWCLDNLFLVDKRKYSYETADLSKINVMLNTNDVSQYLKISPDGLEARCDSHSFESVRCTFQVDSGCWYYETLIITPGVMQIGWATKNSHFLNHDGYGIGDDLYSLSYDGCRRMIWHNARSELQNRPSWRPGDILGCLLDLNTLEVIFSVNGNQLDPCKHVFQTAKTGFFAAASFMSFQQCKFNFGAESFKYPPTDRPFSNFNEYSILSEDEKIIIPRQIYLDRLRKISVKDDSCTLCFDSKATIILEPCQHRGFCSVCTSQLSECPMCRAEIKNTKQEDRT